MEFIQSSESVSNLKFSMKFWFLQLKELMSLLNFGLVYSKLVFMYLYYNRTLTALFDSDKNTHTN